MDVDGEEISAENHPLSQVGWDMSKLPPEEPPAPKGRKRKQASVADANLQPGGPRPLLRHPTLLDPLSTHQERVSQSTAAFHRVP